LIATNNGLVPAGKNEEAEKMWSKLKEAKSLTLYGSSFKATDAVVIAKLDYDKPKMIIDMHTYGDQQIYSAGAKEHQCFKVMRQQKMREDNTEGRDQKDKSLWNKLQAKNSHGFVCLYDDTTIVASGNQARLGQALDILDGQEESLGKKQTLGEMFRSEKGSFMVVGIQNMSEIAGPLQEEMAQQGQPQGALLKNCESLRLELGEADGEMLAKLNATMTSTEDATAIQQVAQGMLALGMMQMGEDERVASLLQAIKIEQKDDTLAIEIKHSFKAVKDILSEMQSKLP
jgi:hypothetical protein